MATFVKFPGTAGNYVSTDDVNRLDADTAHNAQGPGQWSFALLSPQPFSAAWSGFAAVRQNTTGADGYNTITTAGAVPVAGSTEYAAGFTVEVSRSGDYRFAILEEGGLNQYEIIPLTAGVPYRYEKARTSAAGCTGIRLYAGVLSGGTLDETIKIYDSVIALGTDSTFVPSLRIVGDLFESIDPPDMPIVFAGDGTPLTVGEGWAGDGYYYRRYDGANSLAPLVAQFSAEDVPVVAQLPSP